MPMLSGSVPKRLSPPSVSRRTSLFKHRIPSHSHTFRSGIAFVQDQPGESSLFTVRAAAKSHIARSTDVAVGADVGDTVGERVGAEVGVAVVGDVVGREGMLVGHPEGIPEGWPDG